jgi:hypothetical protein
MYLNSISADFYAHHSPFGAFASFTLGRYGKRGGFGLELSGPADQDVYIALVRPGQGTQSFPFYSGSQESGASAYSGDSAFGNVNASNWDPFSPKDITREMGWCSDSWSAGDITFRLLTPFGVVPDITELGDEEIRRHVCPAIFAEITVYNTHSAEDAYAFFGISDKDALRPLSETASGLKGIARASLFGFAVAPSPDHHADDVRETLSWDIQSAVANVSPDKAPPRHHLANRGGVLLRAPAGKARTYIIALGFYRSGVVTSGIACSYLYTRFFSDMEAVLWYAIQHHQRYLAEASQRDTELQNSGMNEERKFLLAHATHSYHGSTMLLDDERGAIPRPPYSAAVAPFHPLWVVNEGEYKMLNTFDLTIDHAFFELRYHPWTLRNVLDLFITRYSYQDQCIDVNNPARPIYLGGISFTHDMGVSNHFTPPGYSSYERPDLDDCFSYMTQEQLCNFCLCAALYGLKTIYGNGDILWLATRRSILISCLKSMVNRDGPENNRDGVMTLDSSRCASGQEITTYDSLDPSLGQARASAYLAVKTWASYLGLSRIFDALGDEDAAAEAEEQAALAVRTITGFWNDEEERFPAVFEKESPGFESQVIPIIEGLIYPLIWGDEEAISPLGPYGQMISQLRRHLRSVLKQGVCIDDVSGGWKMSSTSTNTWMSKIFLSQCVAEKALGVTLPAEYDAAHSRWQREGDCRDFAFTDQVRSTDGGDLGSRYYPRGVTGILWLL